MKKLSKALFVAGVLALLASLMPLTAYAQSVIDTDVNAWADPVVYPANRQSFVSEGRLWKFYSESGTIYFRSSNDNGDTWSAQSASLGVGTAGFQLCYDGAYVHLVRCVAGSGRPMYYRRGDPNADGTITWSSEAFVRNANAGTYSAAHSGFPSIAVDSTGHAFIAWSYYDGPDGGNEIGVVKNANTNGTWSTASTWYPYSGSYYIKVTILGLTSGRMLLVLNNNTSVMIAIRFDGTNWLSTVTGTSQVQNKNFYSAVAQGDDAHIVFLKESTYDIIYVRYSYSTNSFGSETTLHSAATSTSAPTMTRSYDDNALHVFWQNHPLDDHVYYMTKSPGGSWAGYYDLVNEVDTLDANGFYLNSDHTCPRDNLGVYYVAGTTSPPTILKFKLVNEPFVVSTLSPSGIAPTYATLRGEIESLSFSNAEVRGFYTNTLPTVDGATETSETGSFGTGVYSLYQDGFTPHITYYTIAFASNEWGTTYGNWVQWETSRESPQVSTLNPTDISTTSATFNGEISFIDGTCTEYGFHYGHGMTAQWTVKKTGISAHEGQYSIHVTNLESDEIYYVRFYIVWDEGTEEAGWVGFITHQVAYGEGAGGEQEEGLADVVDAIPGDPGLVTGDEPTFDTDIPGVGFLNRLIGATELPVSFFWYVLAMVAAVGLGLLAFAGSRHTLPVFLVGATVFGIMGGLGWVDWWMLLVYILVGLTIMRIESRGFVGGGL